MASRPINVVIKGDYSDKDVKRAIRDLKSLQTQGPRTGAALKKVGIGLGVGTAAAAAFAVKIGVDSVRAAMEDEQSVDKLATTLRNLGLAHEDAGVEKFIDDMQFSSMFADNDLRPAYDRLVRSTKNVGEAQRALQIAMDIAQAKGRSVTQVADVLGKAYDGNTNALGRLGVGISKTMLKSGDLEAITRELSRLFQGQAAAGVENLSGKFKLLQTGIDELEESAGYGFIEGFFTSFENGTDSIDPAVKSLRDAQASVHALTTVLGGLAADGLGALKDFGRGAIFLNYSVGASFRLVERAAINSMDFLGQLGDAEAEAMRRQLDYEDAQAQVVFGQYELATSSNSVATSLDGVGSSANGAASGLDGTGASASGASTSFDAATASADEYRKALDKLNGKNIEVGRSRIQLDRALAEGPGKSGSRTVMGAGEKRVETDALGRRRVVTGPGKKKKVQFSTEQDARLWAYDVAEQAMQTAEDYYARGKSGDRKRGREVIADTRKELIRRLGKYGVDNPSAFVKSILSSPRSGVDMPSTATVDPSLFSKRGPYAAGYSGLAPGLFSGPFGGGNITIEKVEVQTPAAWDQMVKEAQRRVAASGGRFTYPASVTR